MRAPLAWLRSHPKSMIAVGMIALVLGAHRFLDWNTERRWQQYRAEATARGVIFTLEELAPPEIPDDQNFAALPMWRAVLAAPPDSVRIFELPRSSSNRRYDNPIKKTTIDWSIWQQAFRNGGFITEMTDDPVADVLRGLDSFAPKIAQWRKWKRRPLTRFPFDPKQGGELRSPENSELQGAASFFTLRMRAHLAQGDSAAAFEDFTDALQSYRASAGKPFLIGGLIRLSVLQVTISGVGRGLSLQAWKEPELAALEATLAKFSMHQDVHLAISTERAFTNIFYEEMIRDAGKRASLLGVGFPASSPNRWQKLISGSISRRKLRKSQMRTNRNYDDVLANLETQPPAQLVPVDPQGPPEPSLLEQWRFYPFHVMESSGTLDHYLLRAARLENLIAHCRVAIALERYRLIHGSFPEELDALVPALLPAPLLDPWTGRPVIFSRVGSSFRLYSTGRDRMDDGGEINPKKYDTQQRDEIWLYAPP